MLLCILCDPFALGCAFPQVAVYGMNEKVGLVSFRMDRDAFDKPYSDETARLIDEEVRDY